MPDDRTTHTLHRLEAFSDIVIGFCLAQLGLNLFLPRSADDVISVWASTNMLISAFVAIALLWWLYHRVVSIYFVLNTPMVIINFGMLCGVVLSMYFFESVVHLSAIGQNPSRFLTL
ncbi:MAG TPA: TMEM175 family protein [Candidatus Baltobacteraceae bacterium]|nr:TMEM175 family protein [Candidatus Baltobacteraceae bacterium]